jgi:PAS domain S-box-containing protein
MVSTQVSILGYQVNEQLYDGSRTIVYRAFREADNLPVVIKLLKNPYPNFNELVQFRNQYTIGKNLHFKGIIQTYSLEPFHNVYMLVMEDFRAISLKDYFTQNNHAASLDEFLQIAIALSEALNFIICNRILHKDIKPANILINPDTKQVKLIDFSIASLLPRETQTLISPNVLEGTLAYISPEQTGRMNRGIDYRTDFYSLGITFYELLTGQLPFQSEDPMELIHCHIAKVAPFVNTINPQIPSVLSEIVKKLMAKNSEDRYQSALGLKYDLEKCLVQLQQTGGIESFPVAQRDVCDRFIIPDKLYGRETEVEILIQAFARVSQGATEMMLVTGFSGIGKTAVVNEVHKPIVRQRGYFIKGKFDQFNRNIPFSAFVQAFRDLMGQLLAENDIGLEIWKNKILNALGDNGQVIIEVIPELEKIIGQQPPIAELSGTAAQNRFNLLFQKFTQVFTSLEHPLVIFLDDLQWADSTSLKLIQLLMVETKHLFLIGSYRDNEIYTTHPLMLTLSEIEKTQATINTITLTSLSQKYINKLVSDTLKCSEKTSWILSQLVSQKTQGNLFFARQFLKALHQDELIQFNFELRCWQCDIAQVTRQAVTDHVVVFMASQLRKLSPSTQNILQLAACIGNQFDLGTLAIVSEQLEIEAASNLWVALKEGLIVPISDVYRFYIGEETQAVSPDIQETVRYKFLHDRVQQAAYSLIPPNQTPRVHLQIGRLLLERIHREEQDSQLFQIVNQLNCGISLIDDSREREELAKLNQRAGEKARLSSAYDAAMNYLNIGLELLPPQAWQNQYFLSLTLHQLAAEIAYLSGDYDRMTTLLAIGLERAKNDLDRVKFYEIHVVALIAKNQSKAAVEYARLVLPKFGVQLPQDPSSWRATIGFFVTLYRMAGKKPQDLLKLPTMTDPVKLAACQLFNASGAAAASGMPEMLPFITFNGLALYLQYGNIPKSSMGYMIYAYLLCEKLNRVDAGYAFGKVAIRLCHQSSSKEALPPTLFLWQRFIAYRKESLRSTLPLLLEAYQVGLEVGNLEYAAYSLCVYYGQCYFSGQNLLDLQQEAISGRLTLQRLQHSSMLPLQNLLCQVLDNLTNTTSGTCNLVGRFFDETTIIAPEVQVYMSLQKLSLALYFAHYDLAWEQIPQIERLQEIIEGTFFRTLFYFYDVLTRLRLHPHLSKARQPDNLRKIKTHRQYLERLAKSAPTNYQHKWLLVEAEYLRVFGKSSRAGEYYDRAIAGAKANEFIQEAALANELAAKFYLECNRENIASAYMQEAYYCYAKWGAKAKTDDLTERYPNLLHPILQPKIQPSNLVEIIASITTPDFSIHQSIQPSRALSHNINQTLDFVAILTASQSLISKIKLDELLHQLTQIILQNSGGDRCALILPNSDGLWQLEAFATPETVKIASFPLEGDIPLPVKLINYVKNTQEIVVINHLDTDLPIIDDYLTEQQPQSILCLPLLNQGKAIAILYLENRVTSGVFSTDRLLILNFLCTQAAISLENARLFSAEKEKTAQLQSSELRLKTIFDKAADSILLLGDNGFIDCNQATLDLFQYHEKSQLLNIHPSKILPAFQPDGMSSQEKVNLMIQEALKLGTHRFEWVHQRLNGQDFDAEVVLTAIPYKNETILHCLVRDISEQQAILRDRKRLESEQQRLLDVLEATPDYINLASATGEIIWHNKPLRSLRQDLTTHKNISECHPAWVNEIILNQALPVAIEQGSWSGELALIDSNGQEIPVSQVIIAHKSEAGEVQNFSTIMRDISERKKHEEELEQTNAELIRAIRLKDEFLATMSHELRTPLNAILGMTEALQDEIFGVVNEKQLKALGTVERSGNHLLELINDILDVSKITLGQIELDYQNTAIIPLCQQSLEFIKPQAVKKSIQIESKLPIDLPDLSLDERRIRQVLINLLNNAVKFTPEGGCITLEVIHPNIIEAQNYLQINVRDTGIGISPENLNRVFEPFIQIDSSLNRKYEGTGLGLALVKRIVELHQGEVTLTSELGVGSCFAIALPYLNSLLL